MIQSSQCSDIYDPFNLECVIQCGYWPFAVHSLTFLVGQSLLQFWDTLRKRSPGISETSFFQTLSDISVAKERVCKLTIMQSLFFLNC